MPSDSVIGLDLSRRGLHSLVPWVCPGEGEEAPLGRLETLDASRNALACVRGVEHLPRLRVLNLYFNRIEQLAELLRLRVLASSLRVLDLRLNPVTRLEGYRRCVAAEKRPPALPQRPCAHPLLPPRPPPTRTPLLHPIHPASQLCCGAAAAPVAAGRQGRGCGGARAGARGGALGAGGHPRHPCRGLPGR